MSNLEDRIVIPHNCGQELYDVVTISDSLLGLSEVKTRVVGITFTHDRAQTGRSQRLTLAEI